MDLKEFKITLDELIANSDLVFISPHVRADYDALASSIAMSLIVKKLGKEPFIIMSDDIDKMEQGMKTIYNEAKEITSFITKEKAEAMVTNNTLLITVDMNKTYLTACQTFLDKFKSIAIIDHHDKDQDTIITDYQYIMPKLSSASEILTEMLFMSNVKITSRVADYLLAGIFLDTNKFTKNASTKTMETIYKLTKKGGEIARVTDFFTEDYLVDRKIQDLVSKTRFITYTAAVTMGDDNTLYTREELAKAADYLLKYRNIDATFALGLTGEDIINISARSKGTIDVSDVMREMGGGGNEFSAASQIKDSSLEETGEKLARKLVPSCYKFHNN